MPASLQPNAICLMTFKGSQNGQEVLNTFFLQWRNNAPANDYTLIMSDMLDNVTAPGSWVDDYLAFAHSSLTLQAVHIQPVWPNRYTFVQRVVNTSGSRGGTAAPQNVAAVIDKLSVWATRWGRGNWHQPGVIASDNSNGNLSNTAITLLDAVRDNFTTSWAIPQGGVMWPVLWNFQNPTRVTDITGSRVQLELRVMRRRTVGVGS